MIEIQVQGTLKIDDKTTITDPLVIVTTALDNYVDKSVSIDCLFTNAAASFGRNCGSFNYVDTWTDNDVVNYLNTWIENHLI